jgi:hypothetical protein
MPYFSEVIHGGLHLDNELKDILRLARIPQKGHSHLAHLRFWII